jgi:hypothetical protein
MTRRLTVAALVALALAAGAAEADAATVRVIDTSGGRSTVDLGALRGEEDVVGEGYAIRSSRGERTETITGFSLDLILGESQADAILYDHAEVKRPGGGAVQLSNGQIRQSGAFPDGPPVVYDDGGGAAFLRPSTGPGDLNSDDRFTAPTLVVRLSDDPPITVEATASATRAEVGERIAFDATAQAPAGASVRYSWTFGDGSGAKGASATHAFEKPGSYKVLVGATSAEDPTGGSDLVRVTVGEVRKGGPDREGGGEDESRDAADTGAADGTGGSPDGTPGGTGEDPSSGPAGPAGDRDRERRGTEPHTPVETVTGEVLRVPGAAAEPTAEEAAAPTARTGTPEDESAAGVPGAAIGGAAILALFGLGALAELERLRPGRALARLLPGASR